MKAILFDVDGTLVESEQYGHWPACNVALKEMGLSIEWSLAEYKAMHHIQGNARRLRWWLQTYTMMSPEDVNAHVAQFTVCKQRIYIEDYLPQLMLRPGVETLIEEALGAGLRLAVVSTSYERQIQALFSTLLSGYAHHFDPILGKESGLKTGGGLYRECLNQMNVHPHEALAIEDSESGVQAAHQAGIPCVAVYTDFTQDQNFSGATLVTRSLAGFTLDHLHTLCFSKPTPSTRPPQPRLMAVC